MSKYILFGYYDYYPSGGSRDIIGIFDSLEDSKNKMKDLDYMTKSLDNYHILEVDTGMVLDYSIIHKKWDDKPEHFKM